MDHAFLPGPEGRGVMIRAPIVLMVAHTGELLETINPTSGRPCPLKPKAPEGKKMFEGDLVYNHFRPKRISMTIGFAYFINGVGVTGVNVNRIAKIDSIWGFSFQCQ